MLEKVGKIMNVRGNLGGFVSLEVNGKISKPDSGLNYFHRGNEAIVNPNMRKLNLILRHFRVFSIDAFRYIPQTDLRDVYGNYFKDRLIFLMTLLEIVRDPVESYRNFFHIKKYWHVWDTPRKMQFIHQTYYLKNSNDESIDKDQLKFTGGRLECESIALSFISL